MVIIMIIFIFSITSVQIGGLAWAGGWGEGSCTRQKNTKTGRVEGVGGKQCACT